MEAVAVERSAEVIRSGHEELPEHFGFPGSQGFRIDGVNVRVSKESEALQAFQSANVFCESGDDGRIEDVAALHGSGHVQMVFNQKSHFGFFFRRKAKALGGSCEGFEAASDVIFD